MKRSSPNIYARQIMRLDWSVPIHFFYLLKSKYFKNAKKTFRGIYEALGLG